MAHDRRPEANRHTELDGCSRFKRLLAEISSSFIALPIEETDRVIRDALRKVGELLGVDRCSIGLLDRAQDAMVVTHAWSVKPSEHLPSAYPLAQFSWLLSSFRTGKPLVWTNADERPPRLAPAESQLIDAIGLKSFAAVPIFQDGEAKMVLSVVSVSTCLAFDAGLVERLQLLANTFGSAFSRKWAEGELRTERIRAQEYLELAEVIFVSLGADQRVVMINRKGCQVLGWDVEEIVGKNWFEDFIPERHRAGVQATFDNFIAGRIESVEYYENPVLTKGGTERLIAWHNTPLRDKGRVVGTLSSGEDITDRKAAEARLREEKEFAETVLDAQLDTFFLFEPATGKAIRWNRAFREVSGYSDEEIASLPAPAAYYSPSDLERATEHLKQLSANQSTKIELDLVCKDGRTVLTEYRSSIVPNAEGKPKYVISIGRDIRERQRAEEQLRQSQKMEAIGRLAGGVAHDFNNLLCAVTGNVEFALAEARVGTPLREVLEDVAEATARATKLTQQLLAFSRKQVIVPQSVDLNELLSGMRSKLTCLVGEGVILETLLQPNLWRIKIDPGQVEQIVTSLAVNSRDAMSGGGKLVIATLNASLDEASCEQNPSALPGDSVVLSVRDSGCGMDAETRAMVFEPYFTTKGSERGAGLGLSMVYGVVEQNGGTIEVESTVGEGSVFRIAFPRVIEDEAPLRMPLKCAGSGAATILLVDDDDGVRRMAKRMLQRLGYHALEAASGSEALSVADAYEGTIELLLTDVVMPHMNGRQLATQLRDRRPNTKVIYSSGYTHDVIANHGVVDGGVELLAKPYSIQVLSSRIRKVLEG